MTKHFTADPRPCNTCPYAKSTPSGLWAESEYAKLPKYDGETWEQDVHLFSCHKHGPEDNVLCKGWLLTHGTDRLLALRVAGARGHTLDESVYAECDAEVYESGLAAYEAGILEIPNPSPLAIRRIAQVRAQRAKTSVPTTDA